MTKASIDLNSDMGEGFGPWKIGDGVDEQIMPLISSANIATGFHAGDPNIMSRTVLMAREHGVGIGAHPGFRDLAGFGRRDLKESAEGLVNDIVYQLGALREFARLHGVRLQHIKPHGALYMLAARDETLSRRLVQTLRELEPTLYLYCMENSVTCKVARELGQPVVREFYADRDYDSSGSIVFTRYTKALDPAQVAAKVLRACTEGRVRTVEGQDIPIDFDSVCIHSDTPGALELVEATRQHLQAAGIRISPPPFPAL
ncbi:5-oxoprolinase subunit PxpA [Bordetella avium]|uniref:5-oxoprolinase subunit A n=1 Tax=Bordetella avium (strain 197N) TaxID=360910 RepID=Q2KTU9_BORA1|nr:5-oxoprolinase subunit PxpA [Bordetella avium]AZY50622.1 lactam utilization protein LamB [Bordetella avium]AZY54019.1 lactam utilization protein LamB [Bordetella avium]RIQ19986.1 5-oxoprolinase subunit PxpA [Bordetella avium]RIQ34566.1 5-oxoprolinase subunit PxpA [Bordetella avium]RIQ55746.1 5-oxoprolinase subunit PxpA [Bordetella avium]